MPGPLPDVVQKFSIDASGYDAGIARMIKGNEDLIASIGKVKREIAGLGTAMAALGDKRIHVEVTGVSDAIRQVGELKTALDGLGDKRVHIGGDNGEMVQHLKDISTYMDMATDSMQRMEDHLVTIGRNTGDSNAALARQTQILRDNANAHTAAATAVSTLASAHQNAGGGGGAVASGGGGGGGHGGGGGGLGFYGSGAFVPWRGGGFQAVKFWGMAIAEFAATAVPALIAAGAASAVGMKGAEDVILRAKSLGTTVNALGPAYGVTMGSVLGTSGALGRAQDMARGGAYGLAGAGIDFARMGGGAFSQMGVNTLAMMDRGAANMLINYQNRQKAGKGGVGDMMSGGTEWLRRYGDLFSNIGSTVMNLAPYEPGLGGDVLNTLVGGTGFLKQMTQDIPGPILGAIMGAEGGMRWGKALLGGKGLLGRALGLRKVGGIGGLLSKGGEGLFTRGMGGTLGDLGLGMMGAGDALAGAAGPISLAAALSAYGMSWLASTMPSPAQRQVAGLQAGIGQAGFTGAWQPLAHAIVKTTGLAAHIPSGPGVDMMGTNQSPGSFMRFGQIGPTTRQVYAGAATGFAQTMGDLVNAGPQLVSALKKAGLKGVNMADAFQIAQNALLDTTHAFGKDGKLTKTALQMVQQYVTGTPGVAKMTGVSGAFVAADAAQYVMSRPEMKSLQQVNQAMDSMTSIMTGGPAGMATLFGMLGGTPTTVSHGGMKLQPPPAVAAMAKALTSFTSAKGASAWNTFAGSQGLVAAEQQNLDQLRTYMTLGAMGPGHAAGVAGFQLQQLLPMARSSPAALAMVMQQGAQMGIGGYYDPSKSQAANYAAAKEALAHMAGSAKQVNQYMNQAVVKVSNLPAVAKQFVQGTGAHIQAQQVAKAAQDAMNIKGGINIKANTADLVSQLRAAGVTGGAAMKASLDAVLRQAGVSKAQRVKIEGQYFPPHIPKPPDQRFMINGHVNMPPIPHVPNQSFTITGHVVMVGGQVSPYTPAGARANLGGAAAYTHPAPVSPSMYLHRQTGGMVPGSGFGDIIPAMLEPGEVVVPRNLVSLVAPILAAHRVPGFGGMPQSSASHFAAGGVAGGGPITGHAGKDIAWSLIDGITTALKSAGAQKIADALVTKVGKEVALAKNVSSAAMQGQGYGNAGLLGGFDVTPGTGGGTVQEQMQSYLGSVKSFTKDIATLRKGHLNKALISQLVAAGPVQGDALAQSIMNDYGGIKGVNSLWGQLGHATKGLGAQAAMAQYGGTLAPNLRSASVTNNHVTINVNATGSSGHLNLTAAQIKKLVEEVQAALLKQARRNNKTGLQLSGKGA